MDHRLKIIRPGISYFLIHRGFHRAIRFMANHYDNLFKRRKKRVFIALGKFSFDLECWSLLDRLVDRKSFRGVGTLFDNFRRSSKEISILLVRRSYSYLT